MPGCISANSRRSLWLKNVLWNFSSLSDSLRSSGWHRCLTASTGAETITPDTDSISCYLLDANERRTFSNEVGQTRGKIGTTSSHRIIAQRCRLFDEAPTSISAQTSANSRISSLEQRKLYDECLTMNKLTPSSLIHISRREQNEQVLKYRKPGVLCRCLFMPMFKAFSDSEKRFC